MDNIIEKIYKAGLKLLEPLTTEETYEIIVKEAIKLVNAKYGSLTLEDGGSFKEAYSTLPVRVSRRKKGFTYRAYKELKVFIIHTKESPEFMEYRPNWLKMGIRSVILIPLSYRNKAIGVLALNSDRKEQFTSKEENILLLFGSLASLALRKTQLYDETKKALETRDIFISMAAHELRTPLTSIHGYAQLLRHKLANTNSVESRWAELLYGESIRMTLLVNELLEINRIKSGKLNYVWKECNLQEIVDRVHQNFILSHPERKILFENKLGGESSLIVGDYDKILQVLTNIVDNAAKFSGEDKQIHLSLDSKDQDFVIRVKDEGVGIPKEEIPKIFEGYYRGQNNHVKEGMGLGLFIVKDIINHHHGSINVKSKISRGTTIEVILPKMEP